jgi:hypothetical protein
LIEKLPSARDSRRNIYFPTEYPANGHNTVGNKIRVTDHNLYPSRNVIEESFRTLVKCNAEDTKIFDQITDYRIEDVDGRKIELDELLDRYYNRPEEYFEE